MAPSQSSEIDFSNTEIAFSHLSNAQLRQAYYLFKIIGQPLIVKMGPVCTDFALTFRLPVKTLIKKTIFSHFCGGETIRDCKSRIDSLARYHVGTILDFAREGGGTEEDFDLVAAEIKRTIDMAAESSHIPFAVFKPTGIASLELLSKVERKADLSVRERKAWARVEERFQDITQHAARKQVRVMVDAEESWIQDTVDGLVYNAMKQHNKEKAIVYNTVQLYRHDRNDYLKALLDLAEQQDFHVGVKLVRGAYLEKELRVAAAEGRPSPLNPSKAATDAAYDRALQQCIERIDRCSIVAGTHNEASTKLLTQLMQAAGIKPQDERVFFAQLLGMSDNLSYNLAAAGFSVAKYVPYGTINELLPYLTRRAQENSSVAGQSSRELMLLESELKRRASTR